MDALLEKYAVFGLKEFQMPDSLKVPPISAQGTVLEIAELFGGVPKLQEAVETLQKLLYAA